MQNCLDSYQKHTDEVISLQALLLDINEENYSSTVSTIKSSKLYLDKDCMKILLRTLGLFVKIRKIKMLLYFRLIDDIISKIFENFNKIEMMTFFKQKEIHLKLLKDKLITIEDVASFYGHGDQKLSYFYPEMKALFAEYPSYPGEMSDKQRYDAIIEFFSQKEAEAVSIDEDPRLQIGNIDKLSKSIQKDDIDEFQRITSQSNINIQTHKIPINCFESKKYLGSEIYLIEYASFHGSLKVFKFLSMNDTCFSEKFLEFAICGGNNEIVHLVEDKVKQENRYQNTNYLLQRAIHFHHYDLSEYLINTFEIEVIAEHFSSSIVSLNYSSFSDHISDYVQKFNDKKNSENIDKFSESLLMAAGCFDIYFLKVISCFNEIGLNTSNEYLVTDELLTNPLTFSIQSLYCNENAKFLLSFDSVDVDIKLMYNMTPFTWACYVGNLEIVKILVNDYYLNQKNPKKKINILLSIVESGENALHLAVRENHLDVVKYLISLDVFDISLKHGKGESPIETAARLGYSDMFDFLKSKHIDKRIPFDDNLHLEKQKFLPTKHRKPLPMGYSLFDNLKEPISLCLLI